MTSSLETLRSARQRIENSIAVEREAITKLRAQLTRHRRIPLPSLSLGVADGFDLLAVQASLSAHQATLTRLEVARDRVERDLANAKSAAPHAPMLDRSKGDTK